jgi:hypothetical protein
MVAISSESERCGACEMDDGSQVGMYSEDPQSTDELQISSTTSHQKFLAKAMDKLS